MYYSIEKLIYTHYGIVGKVIEKRANIYIIQSYDKYYVLKECIDLKYELLHYTSNYLVSILVTLDGKYYFDHYILMPYVPIEQNDCLKEKGYLILLGKLHLETLMIKEVSDEFYSYEIKKMKELFINFKTFFNQCINDIHEQNCYHPAYFMLLQWCINLQRLEQFFNELLNQYQQLLTKKTTARFCLSLNKIDINHYAKHTQCFISRDHASYELVGKDCLLMILNDIQIENIEAFYLKRFELLEDEKIYILLHLCLFEPWNFYDDALSSIQQLIHLQKCYDQIIKIAKCLQIDATILYNE